MQDLTRDDFVSAASRIAGSVYDLHHRFAIPRADTLRAREESLERLRIRLAFLTEELGEHARELNNGNLEQAAAELADTAFVALGSILVLDSLGRDACLAVARKNDEKTSATHALDDSSGKLLRRAGTP